MNAPLLLLALSVAAAPAAGDDPAPARVRAVRPAAPTGGALVPATVAAVRRATISTRVAAAVRDVHVREGSRVAAGQLLVSLSDSDVRGAVGASETGLAAAAAHERRIRELAAERAATPSEVEMAAAQRAQAEAAVASARATLRYTELRAPFAGTVQARRIDPGDFVGPGQPLLELEGDALELVATLSEAEAKPIALGATVRFDAEGARGTATVTALTPGGDPVSHRRTVRARVASTAGELRTGAFARLEVPGAAAAPSGAVWIPRTALVERGDLAGVFVASGGRAELRWLALGERGGEHVLVQAGLRPGETVVDAPGALRDGQRVEVLP
jgi:RND family efflux transporter MFP subunit